MRRRGRKSKRGRGSRDKRGIKKYDYHDKRDYYVNAHTAINKEHKKTRKTVGTETSQTVRKNQGRKQRGFLDDIHRNIQSTFIPDCAKRKAKVRRDYFSFKKAKPNIRIKNPGKGGRFDKGVCR